MWAATTARGGGCPAPRRPASRRPRACLLAGLKDRQQRRRQSLAQSVAPHAQSDQRGHVDVVAAGVHRLARGAELRPGPLAQWQPVELGPGPRPAPRPPAGPISARRPVPANAPGSTGSSAEIASAVRSSWCASSGSPCRRWRSSTAPASSRSSAASSACVTSVDTGIADAAPPRDSAPAVAANSARLTLR